MSTILSQRTCEKNTGPADAWRCERRHRQNPRRAVSIGMVAKRDGWCSPPRSAVRAALLIALKLLHKLAITYAIGVVLTALAARVEVGNAAIVETVHMAYVPIDAAVIDPCDTSLDSEYIACVSGNCSSCRKIVRQGKPRVIQCHLQYISPLSQILDS